MAEAIEAKYPELAEIRANPPEPKKPKKKGGGADGRGRGRRGGRGARGRGGRGRGAGGFFVPVLPGLPDPNTDEGGDDETDENADEAGGEGEQKKRPPVTWVTLVDKLGASTPIFKRHVSRDLPT